MHIYDNDVKLCSCIIMTYRMSMKLRMSHTFCPRLLFFDGKFSIGKTIAQFKNSRKLSAIRNFPRLESHVIIKHGILNVHNECHDFFI